MFWGGVDRGPRSAVRRSRALIEDEDEEAGGEEGEKGAMVWGMGAIVLVLSEG